MQGLAAELSGLGASASRVELGKARRLLESWEAALASGLNWSEVVGEEEAARLEGRPPAWHWNLPAALLYAFTVITTIGGLIECCLVARQHWDICKAMAI